MCNFLITHLFISVWQINLHSLNISFIPPQEAFYLRAIPTVLPWTFVPAMALKTQAQVALSKMWRDCEEAGFSSVMDRFPGVAVCMDFTQNNRCGTLFPILQ